MFGVKFWALCFALLDVSSSSAAGCLCALYLFVGVETRWVLTSLPETASHACKFGGFPTYKFWALCFALLDVSLSSATGCLCALYLFVGVETRWVLTSLPETASHACKFGGFPTYKFWALCFALLDVTSSIALVLTIVMVSPSAAAAHCAVAYVPVATQGGIYKPGWSCQ